MTVCMKRLFLQRALAFEHHWRYHCQTFAAGRCIIKRCPGPPPGFWGALKTFSWQPKNAAAANCCWVSYKNLHGGWGISRQWSDGASVLWSEGSYIYDNIHLHIVIYSYPQTKRFFSIRKRLLHGVWGFQGSGHRGVCHPGAD